MSPEVKERLEIVFDIAKTTFHWGFVPMVLYLDMDFENKLDYVLNKILLEALPVKLDVILKQQAELGIKVDQCLKRQDELAKIMGENNILLSRNLSNFSAAFNHFPIKSDENLKTIENDLMGENRENLVTSMRRLLCGDLNKNLERILDPDLLSQYNYDGTKGKKALKLYSNFITALKDCTSFSTFEEFLTYLRTVVKKVKNRDAKRHYRANDQTQNSM